MRSNQHPFRIWLPMFLRKTCTTASATAAVLSTSKGSLQGISVLAYSSTTSLHLSGRPCYFRNVPSARSFSKMPENQAKETIASGQKPGEEPGELKTGDYKYRSPYRIHTSADEFHSEWDGSCHCGRVTYQLSRKKPLKAKYCHCTTCQVLHAAPFQWAAIFSKDDINFTNGHESLTWYDSPAKKLTHQLPCKVSCSYCRTPIMDEGRNMILIYPGLIKGIEKKQNMENFRPSYVHFLQISISLVLLVIKFVIK